MKVSVIFLLIRLIKIESLASASSKIQSYNDDGVKIISIKHNGVISRPFRQNNEMQPLDNISSNQKFAIGKKEKLKSIVKKTFLPDGFPNKTPPGYLSYSIWSWVQDLSTQLRAILATQKVLEGLGVGREGATALSASINFIVRDGCGMASNLIFTATSSDKFKSDVKKWRLFADIMNDVGITLEVAATLVPSYFFLPMICKFLNEYLLLWCCIQIKISRY